MSSTGKNPLYIFEYIDSLEQHKDLQNTKLNAKRTPSMKEWEDFKKKSIEEFGKYSIVLYQLGSFFECYFEDAFVLSKILNVALTRKNKNLEYSPYMSGFGIDFLDDKVNPLLEAGLHVIVVSQKGDVTTNITREVTDIFTPGPRDDNNYYASIMFDTADKKWKISYIDVNSLRYHTYVYTVDNLEDEHFRSLQALYQPNIYVIHS